MEYPMGKAQVDIDAIAKDPVRNGMRLTHLVMETERVFDQYQADSVVRNLAYYRGKFWAGDGFGPKSSKHRAYQAASNEVFPAVDTITSALSQGLQLSYVI